MYNNLHLVVRRCCTKSVKIIARIEESAVIKRTIEHFDRRDCQHQ